MMVAIYTTDMKSKIVAGSIRFATQWNRSHVLLAFTETFRLDGDFLGDYFESINKVDMITGKTGVRGPVPMGNLFEWAHKDPENHKITMQPLPWFTDLEIEETRRRLQDACNLIKYPKITEQLLDNAKMLLSGYKFGIPPINRNITQWDCSETVVRAVPEWFRVEALNLGEWLYEEYVPGTMRGENPAFGPGLYQMIESYREKRKNV